MQPCGENMTERARSAMVVENVDWKERGVSGGVSGSSKALWYEGGRYVMPMAL